MSNKQQQTREAIPNHRLRLLPGIIRYSLLASAGALMVQGATLRQAHAGPQGGNVVAGQGQINAPNSTTTVVQQQSNSLVVNWQTFNVKKNELVQFNQPSASASVLNRVLNQTPSQIAGAVKANGKVFLLNPSGVVIGNNARVNVGSLFVSSLDTKNADFMNGKHKFQAKDGSKPGAIINRGLIQAATGGSVTLVGSQVTNEGVIIANAGHVNLAAGRTATVDFNGDGLIHFEVDGEVLENVNGADAAVSNSGEIRADGGQVLLAARAASDVFTRAVNNKGLIRAGGIKKVGGKVMLTGFGGAQGQDRSNGQSGGVLNTGTIDASGSSGGDVSIRSDSLVEQFGTVRAEGRQGDGGRVQLASLDTTVVGGDSVTSVRSDAANGGVIEVLGERVALVGQSRVDASGKTAGGRVLVGGDYQGANPQIKNASKTLVGSGATINADAREHGDGGTVIVWSDDSTRFFGDISARGGQMAGNGGLVETSGKQTLQFAGTVDASAVNGQAGLLLLDPESIRVVNAGTKADLVGVTGDDTNANVYAFAEDAADDSTIDASVIVALLDVGTSVTLQAHDDIQIDEEIVATGVVGGALTLQAGDDVIINQNITTLDANIQVTANDPGATPTVADGTLDVEGTGDVVMADGAVLSSGTGSIILSGENVALGQLSTAVTGAVNVTATTGAVTDATAAEAANVITGTATFSASTGIGGAGAADIDTTVTTLNATSATGGIVIGETDGAIIGAVATTTSGDVNLNSGGFVTNSAGTITTAGNGNINVTTTGGGITLANAVTANGAGNVTLNANQLLTVNAPVSSTSGNLLLTGDMGATFAATGDVTTGGTGTLGVTATANDITMVDGTVFTAAGGTVTLAAAINVSLGAIANATGASSVTATAGAITEVTAAETANVLGTTATFAAGAGIGAVGAGDIDTTVTTLVSGSATGGIVISDTDGVNLGATATTASGDVTIVAGGALTNTAGAVTTAGNGNINLSTTAGGMTLSNAVTANGSGNVTLNANQLLAVTAAVGSSTGNLQLTGGTGAQFAAGGDLTTGGAGTLGVTATLGDIVMSDGTLFSAGGGAVTLLAGSNVQLGGISNLAGTSSVTATAGSITDITAAEAANVLGTTATFAAATGIGALGVGDIDTTVTTLLSSTGTGGIVVSDTDAVDLGAIATTTGGDVTITAGGLLSNSVGTVTTAGNGNINLSTTAGGMTLSNAVTANGSGNATLNANQLLTVNAPVSSTSGNLLLTGGTGATFAATGDVTTGGAGTLGVTATANDITMTDGTLFTAGGGTVTLAAANGVALGSIANATGSSSVTATAGAITDITAAETANVLATTATFAAGTGVGVAGAGDIDTTVATLVSSTGSGGIFVSDSDGLALGTTQTTTSGDVVIAAGGAITTTGNIMTAGGGGIDISTSAGAISLSNALTANGDLASTPGVGIRVVSPTAVTVDGLLSTAGAATGSLQVVGGGVTVNTAPVTGASNILLSAGGADIIVNADRIEANTISLLANRDIIVQNLISATGATSDVLLTADFDSDGSGGVRVETSGQILAGRNVVLTGSDLFATATAGDAVVIALDAANNQVQAAGSVTLQAGAAAPAGADIVVNGLVTSSGAGVVLFDASNAAGEVQVSADLTNAGGTLQFADASVLSGGARNLTANSVRFDGTVNGGAADLTITGGADINGVVSNITNLNVTGTSNIAANVTTTGSQTYQGAVTLDGGNPNLTATAVNLQSTVAGGANALSIIGNANIDAAISALASLNVTGTSTIAANVTSTGTQTYQNAVTLDGGNPNLTASTVNFSNTVAGGANNLTVTGNANIDNAISGVANLLVTGTTDLGADVATSGSQNYTGAVTLSGANRTVSSSGAGAISYGNTLTGPFALTVNTTGATTFSGTVNVARITTNAGGSTAINGGAVTTTTTQAYMDTVSFNQNTTLTGSAVGFASGANGAANNLTLSVDDVAIGGALSAGIVTIDTLTAARNIDLGTNVGTELSLSAAELAFVNATTLRIGDFAAPTNGGITVSAAVNGGNVLALRSTGAVDDAAGVGSVTATSLGVVGAAAVTLAGANDVTNLAINTPAAISFTDSSGFQISTVDSIVGVNSGAANTTLVAAGNITQAAGARVVAATLNATASAGGNITLGDGTNDINTLIADAGSSLTFVDVDDLIVGDGAGGEVSASGGVTLTAGTTLTLADDIEAGPMATVNSGGNFVATAGLIEATNLIVNSGGVANLNNPAGHSVSNVTGTSVGDFSLAANRTVGVGINAGAGSISVRTTPASGGDINGLGTLTGTNLALNAAGGIGLANAITSAAAGTVSLTTAGAAAAGNINVIDTSAGAFSTSRLATVSTSGPGQTISLTDAAGFSFDGVPAGAVLSGDTLNLNGNTTLNSNLNVPNSSTVNINGMTTVGAGNNLGGPGAIAFNGTVDSAGNSLTVGTAMASFSSNINMSGGTTLTLNSTDTNFIGDSTIATDSLVLGGGAGSVDGPGSLTVLRASASSAETNIGGATDPLFSTNNVMALNGFNGTLNIGGSRTTAPAAPAQVLNDVQITNALATDGDVFIIGAGDVLFSGAGRVSSPTGTVSVLALGKSGVAESGNIRDDNPSPSPSAPNFIQANALELLAANQIGSELSSEGATLNFFANTVSAAQVLEGDAQVDNTNRFAGSSESVLGVQNVYSIAAAPGANLANVFNDSFSGIAGLSALSVTAITTPQQAKGELGFIDEGVFLLPPAFTNPERAMLMPVLGDPDFPGDQRPEDAFDEELWQAFFEEVVREFIGSRYPLEEGASAAEKATVEALVTAELEAVIAYYAKVRERERTQLAAEAAAEELLDSEAEEDDELLLDDDEPVAPEAFDEVQAEARGTGQALGFIGRPWAMGGIGFEVRG